LATFFMCAAVAVSTESSPPRAEKEDKNMIITGILKLEEGFRARPYNDSLGYVTIGYGTKVHTDRLPAEDFLMEVTPAQAELWLLRDLMAMEKGIRNSHVLGIYEDAIEGNVARRAVILSMCYQMGVEGVLKFHDMWAALAVFNYDAAAAAMLHSTWAEQTPARAERHAALMRGANIVYHYPQLGAL